MFTRLFTLRRALVLGASLFGLGLGLGACDSKSLGDETCQEGDTKEVDCNTCTCAGGQWACTEKACAPYEPCLGKACGDSCTVCDPEDPDCFETQVLKACDAEGACVPEVPVCEAACVDGDEKMVDCNTCACEGGQWVCTEIGCGGYEPCAGKSCGDSCTLCDPQDPECVEDQAVKACDAEGVCSVEVPVCEPACKDGDQKMVDCNTCTCEGGQWACTEIACYDPCLGKACGDGCQLCPPEDPECIETDVIKACDPEGACVPAAPELCEGAYVPCEGKSCGDPCTICAPDDLDCAEDAVIKACDTKGECVPDDMMLCL